MRSDMSQHFSDCMTVGDGRPKICWQRVFQNHLPTKLEICAGSGEWVVAQANASAAEANWAAIEIMRDRVHNIFSQMVFERVSNLCVIGGDAATILQRHILARSVEHVFINFPEPPHVSGDEAGESSLHLLTESFFLGRALGAATLRPNHNTD